MTEAQWATCSYPDVLLDFVCRRLSARKVRLFAVACCRRIAERMTDPLCLRAVAVAERHAEGQADDRELAECEAALEPLCQGLADGPPRAAYRAAYRCAHRVPYHAALWTAYWASKYDVPAPQREQAALLRHIAGNPFRPADAGRLPAPVVALAEALYDGTDCAYALHDALLDAGQAELAGHFQAPHHPKGCWALDRILGKT